MTRMKRSSSSDEGFAATVAIGIVACQWWIMDELRVPSRWAGPALATALAGALLFLWLLPGGRAGRLTALRIVLVGVLVLSNVINLVALGAQAFFHAPPGALELLFTGVILWVMNVLVFGLVYWVLDCGGPEARMHGGRVVRDFVFPQHKDTDNSPNGWKLSFGDYLYLAFTGAVAFGPTDVQPYTLRAKAAMTVEGALALATLGVIIARAVSLAGP